MNRRSKTKINLPNEVACLVAIAINDFLVVTKSFDNDDRLNSHKEKISGSVILFRSSSGTFVALCFIINDNTKLISDVYFSI